MVKLTNGFTIEELYNNAYERVMDRLRDIGSDIPLNIKLDYLHKIEDIISKE